MYPVYNQRHTLASQIVVQCSLNTEEFIEFIATQKITLNIFVHKRICPETWPVYLLASLLNVWPFTSLHATAPMESNQGRSSRKFSSLSLGLKQILSQSHGRD